MADINLFFKKYQPYISTFKATSFDSENKIYMCQDKSQDVLNFDKLVEFIYPDPNKRPKSFDAIYYYHEEKTIYLVEFKNQNKPNKKEIEDKLINGKKELEMVFTDLHIQKRDYKFIFCLVYNKYIPKEARFKRGLFKAITFEYLNIYKKSFVDDIFTEDVVFFTKLFKNKIKKELNC